MKLKSNEEFVFLVDDFYLHLGDSGEENQFKNWFRHRVFDPGESRSPATEKQIIERKVSRLAIRAKNFLTGKLSLTANQTADLVITLQDYFATETLKSSLSQLLDLTEVVQERADDFWVDFWQDDQIVEIYKKQFLHCVRGKKFSFPALKTLLLEDIVAEGPISDIILRDYLINPEKYPPHFSSLFKPILQDHFAQEYLFEFLLEETPFPGASILREVFELRDEPSFEELQGKARTLWFEGIPSNIQEKLDALNPERKKTISLWDKLFTSTNTSPATLWVEFLEQYQKFPVILPSQNGPPATIRNWPNDNGNLAKLIKNLFTKKNFPGNTETRAQIISSFLDSAPSPSILPKDLIEMLKKQVGYYITDSEFERALRLIPKEKWESDEIFTLVLNADTPDKRSTLKQWFLLEETEDLFDEEDLGRFTRDIDVINGWREHVPWIPPSAYRIKWEDTLIELSPRHFSKLRWVTEFEIPTAALLKAIEMTTGGLAFFQALPTNHQKQVLQYFVTADMPVPATLQSIVDRPPKHLADIARNLPKSAAGGGGGDACAAPLIFILSVDQMENSRAKMSAK